MYAGRKLQPVSIGPTTELLNGPDRSRGAEESRVTGQDRWGGGGQEDVGIFPEQWERGFMDGAQLQHCYSPRCIVGSAQAKVGTREIPRAFSVIFLLLSCSRHFSAEKCAGLLASVGK